MLSSLRAGTKFLRPHSGGEATSILRRFEVGRFAPNPRSCLVAVYLGSALAPGGVHSSWLLEDGYLLGSPLLSLRHFTTEQRGTTVLCVRKLGKVDNSSCSSGCVSNVAGNMHML